MPGRAWNVTLTFTSYGSVYPPATLYSDWNGGTWLQNRKLLAFDGVFDAGDDVGPSQLLVAVRSVVMPPKTNPPCGSRALRLNSIPLYTRVFFVDQVNTLLT